MNKFVVFVLLSVMTVVINAQVTIIELHNQLPSKVFVTLSTTDLANNRQLSSQFSIDADDTLKKEITLAQGQSFTMQISNSDATWKKATITFQSMMLTKDNPPSKRTFNFNLQLDDTTVNPITITDSPRNNTLKNSRLTLHIKKDGVMID